ncbi:alpha/beta hydrolase [Streptomyces sp. NPDC001262]|uniref:alpha/beta hydrolase n=1 Tax=unclassified Streptomyces TaxID=2593676 RepID=UPI0036B7DC27
MRRETEVEITGLDGLRLVGTYESVADPKTCAVLVHGGGVTREEGGFFKRLSAGLAAAGVAVLRFDLRGHGESEGRQEDLTLAAVANDIRSATEFAVERSGAESVHLVGASFSGGVTAMAAAAQPEGVCGLVLFNPLFDYKHRFIDQKPYWKADRLQPDEAKQLVTHGFLRHSPTFKLGRPLLNEVFHVLPGEYLARVRQRTLVVHGTKDTFIPVESSRRFLPMLGTSDRNLLEIDGAQHGIAMPDDPGYEDPQTQAWQRQVVVAVAQWMVTGRQ